MSTRSPSTNSATIEVTAADFDKEEKALEQGDDNRDFLVKFVPGDLRNPHVRPVPLYLKFSVC